MFSTQKGTLYPHAMRFVFTLLFIMLSYTTVIAQQQNILFFGDSITAGYGLDKNQAYPAIVQQMADSAGLKLKMINSGLSGETSAGGLRRIGWVLQQQVDVFVLELGGNDGLRGISTQETFSNLSMIIDQVKAKYPAVKIVVAGMQMPPNMGEKYTQDFAAIFPKLASKYDAYLIPFILDEVGGIKELNQADGIHPTAEGHRIIAKNVWEHLKQLLNT